MLSFTTHGTAGSAPCQPRHESPFGGKLDGFMPAPATIRTNVKVFRPAHSPFHFSSLSRDASSLRSGIQNPDLYSLCSFCTRLLRRSSWLVGGLPGLLCAFTDSSSAPSRAIKLYRQQSDVVAGEEMHLHSCQCLYFVLRKRSTHVRQRRLEESDPLYCIFDTSAERLNTVHYRPTVSLISPCCGGKQFVELVLSRAGSSQSL